MNKACAKCLQIHLSTSPSLTVFHLEQSLEKIESKAAAEHAALEEKHKLVVEKIEVDRAELMQVDHIFSIYMHLCCTLLTCDITNAEVNAYVASLSLFLLYFAKLTTSKHAPFAGFIAPPLLQVCMLLNITLAFHRHPKQLHAWHQECNGMLCTYIPVCRAENPKSWSESFC